MSVTIVSLAFVEVDLSTSLWWIRVLMFLRGISMSFAFIPLQAATYANISGANTGRASALYSTQRQVGGALGVAVLATVWLSRTNALTAGVTGTASVRAAQVGGFHDAFLAATFFSIVAAGAAVMIRDRDAAAKLPMIFGAHAAGEEDRQPLAVAVH